MNLTQPVTKGLNDAQTFAPDPFFSVLYKIITTYEGYMKDLIFYFRPKHSMLKMPLSEPRFITSFLGLLVYDECNYFILLKRVFYFLCLTS